MLKFTKDEAYQILMNEVDPRTLSKKYPSLHKMVMDDIAKFSDESSADHIVTFLGKYKAKAGYAVNKINRSGKSRKSIETYLPDIIKARIAIDIIEQLNIIAHSDKLSGSFRFNLWDGFILQRILFKKGLERKPVSLFLFKLLWPLITNKKILMPLVNGKGIYCFYSKKLLKELANMIGPSPCVEIGAGDGTLTNFLNGMGSKCIATDDYSWANYINYPDFVEKRSAKEALQKYKPETVISSWTPPNNTFEQNIFDMESVKLYIAIGTRNPTFSGNHETYHNQKNFTMEYSPQLSALILPPSKQNAVYIFRRRDDSNNNTSIPILNKS